MVANIGSQRRNRALGRPPGVRRRIVNLRFCGYALQAEEQAGEEQGKLLPETR